MSILFFNLIQQFPLIPVYEFDASPKPISEKNLKFTHFLSSMTMVSTSGFLPSLTCFFTVYLIPFFILIYTYISRFRMFGYFFKKNDSDLIEKENSDKSELHMKFKFPTFEEFSRGGLSSANCNKYQLASGENSAAAASFEVLTTFSVKEINGDGIAVTEVENEKIEAIELVTEFGENQDFLDFSSEENCDTFLSDGDFGEEMDPETELESDEVGECFGDEIKNVEQNDGSESEFLSENDFHDEENNAGFVFKDDESLKPKESTDSNKLEPLWEHQELIEQLQMELRKAKATGLPTIFEESESPKMVDELNPWKIDDEFKHESFMGELHRSYKSYVEMMRKFDILNYQKMYAMGFLQLKDPFHSTSQQKSSAPTLKSLVSENIWLFKHKSHGSDPVRKFVNELQGDLEVVYVGQMCLSWEFLRWQYEKALDLWSSDPHGIHHYNEVAGEFQQFQVLIQRFTENEPFQGPRVQNYVKSRCVLRNLLQVPLVREDCSEENNTARKIETNEHVITSESLVEMVEESIRIFWQFVRADKDCAMSMNTRKKMPDLQSPQDAKLLLDVRKTLQKKEKKLKDILKSEKCILRRFRESREDDSDEALHFFAQLDVKLVTRVVNMSNISRDQLIWCQNKLSRISIVNRKISVEPAFLLFPC